MIIDIPASEIDLGDVLGEGMQIWCIVTNDVNSRVVMWWGTPQTCLMNNACQDAEHRLEFEADEIVRVLRVKQRR